MAFSIVLPAVAAGIVFKRSNTETYWPLFALIAFGLMNEILSAILVRTIGNNAVNNNIYSFMEGVLLLLQFYYWKLMPARRALWAVLLLLAVGLWCWENLVHGSIQAFDNLYRVYYNVLVSVLSVLLLVRLGSEVGMPLWRRAKFWFCVGFLLYFGVNGIIEVLLLYGNEASKAYVNEIFTGVLFVNVLANIVYLIAFVWIPQKPVFIRG